MGAHEYAEPGGIHQFQPGDVEVKIADASIDRSVQNAARVRD